MEKLNLTLTENQNEVIIRTGDAPRNLKRDFLEIQSTNLSAIGSFIEAKLKEVKSEIVYDFKSSIISYSLEKGMINLLISPNLDRSLQTEINAQLIIDYSANDLGINSDKKMNLEELKKAIKWNRFRFRSYSEYDDFIYKLANFNAKVNHNLSQINQKDGNSHQSLSTEVDTAMQDLKFFMALPTFKGEPDRFFEIELIIHAAGSSLHFSLESLDFYDYMKNYMKNSVMNEISKIQNLLDSNGIDSIAFIEVE